MTEQFDVAIIGAGPAGSSTAICLAESGLKIALIDKSEFPRDKICGDALSPDITMQLNKLPLNTGELYTSTVPKLPCNALRIVSPSYTHFDIPLGHIKNQCHIATRMDFDNFMYTQATKPENVHPFVGKQVLSIVASENHHTIQLKDGTSIEAKMVVGSDGTNSIVAKALTDIKLDRNHHFAGLRVYYENVTGCSEDNAIELHFYPDVLPGYFWIFPLPDNKANVGLGMLSSYVSKNKVNLKEKLAEIIASHPNVAPRFKDATALETIKGHGLPAGSRDIPRSGNRFLLAGDAAYLINPLTGEGVGNAIRSGRIAAEHILNAFKANRFDAKFNKAYDKEIRSRMRKELRVSYYIQRVSRNSRLVKFFLNRAANNNSIQKLLKSGFDPTALEDNLKSFKFYRILFFGK